MTWITRRRRPRPGPRDESGSLPLAMLLTLVGMSLSAILVPIVFDQIVATRTSADRSLALHAAEAGLHTAMGHIRAAADGTGAGDLPLLPADPLTGSIGPGGSQRYRVTVSYRNLDGAPLTALTAQPTSAVIVSTGIAAPTGSFDVGTAGSRTLQATYSFRLSNQTIPGGRIHVRSASIDLCLDAGSTRPTAGTPVTMQRCAEGSARQIFAYNPDLTLVLLSSRSESNTLGMCLDAGFPHVSGALVVLQQCSATSPPPPRHRWSINDSANLMGTSDGTYLDGYCFNVQNPDFTGSRVVLSNIRCNSGYDNEQTFQPDPAVGAGAAGPATRQLVNYQQFGRCLDITDWYLGTTYLIAWPCKQAPDPSTIGWNQKWTLPTPSPGSHSSTGRIYATVDGTDYCLRSPRQPGGYPVLGACSSTSVPADMTWTVFGATGVYATSFRIVDGAGLCLAPVDPVKSPTLVYTGSYSGPPISRIVMQACDASGWQKWNAPADLSKPLPLTQITER
ncbi:ricin-type beta-trefoil lectin domain protein [Actinoplanes sp. NEAU-A12]|uniref:Ricin-type beta-trefoil lectin domain protein n=1 Tax=Actinoplanes sandaracinus TaxID=3045177 RepID=A0ABT6WC52_9ACTN|nr:ricin-type beta-trefoil lectin domain protein [Actinoplanes sandaracinus]MDI6097332.1 ricin-type beta-trefoil lectin domain protein [Actinoplanes sandaracinus]